MWEEPTANHSCENCGDDKDKEIGFLEFRHAILTEKEDGKYKGKVGELESLRVGEKEGWREEYCRNGNLLS